jgi:hypothetical protein
VKRGSAGGQSVTRGVAGNTRFWGRSSPPDAGLAVVHRTRCLPAGAMGATPSRSPWKPPVRGYALSHMRTCDMHFIAHACIQRRILSLAQAFDGLSMEIRFWLKLLGLCLLGGLTAYYRMWGQQLSKVICQPSISNQVVVCQVTGLGFVVRCSSSIMINNCACQSLASCQRRHHLSASIMCDIWKFSLLGIQTVT